MQYSNFTVFRAAARPAPLILIWLLLGVSASCVTHFEFDFHGEAKVDNTLGPTLIAEHSASDGSRTRYSVSGQSWRFPRGSDKLKGALLIVRETSVELPFLGLDVKSVDQVTSDELGIEAWRGVLVAKVEPDSAAHEAGLRRGDLLLSANGTALVSEAQFAELVSGILDPGDIIELILSRLSGEFAREEMSVPVTLGSRTVDETAADRVDLSFDTQLVKRAGIGVFTVSADLAEPIYGAREPAAVIGAVITGSPAYLAGFRAGDRVLAANGVPVSTTQQLREVVERGGDRVALRVTSLLGGHERAFDLKNDLMDESEFSIPIIVDYASRPEHSSLSVLDFIFQFGFNKRVDYFLSPTRKPRKSSSLSILPLGMFEFKRTPTKVSNRIFWLIRWSSKR